MRPRNDHLPHFTIATQVIVRSEGNKQALSLKTVVYDGIEIGGLTENGITVFELPPDGNCSKNIIDRIVYVMTLIIALIFDLTIIHVQSIYSKNTKESTFDQLHQNKQQVLQKREDSVDSMWNIHFAQLEAYKEQHGDCFVPKSYQLSPELHNFFQEQLHRCCPIDHRRKLRTLGFCFDQKEEVA